jgi:hypothetical protein
MKPILYVAGGLIVAVVVVQLFLRYQYIHTIGVRITRIDRLTGASCELPCEAVAFTPASTNTIAPDSPPIPSPTRTSAVDALLHDPRVVPCSDLPANIRTRMKQCRPPLPPGAGPAPSGTTDQ